MMKVVLTASLMVLMCKLMYAQCNVSLAQGSYFSGDCGDITIQGGIGGGASLYGQCGDLQFVPPWAGGDVVTSVIPVLHNEINVYPNPTTGFVFVQEGKKFDFVQVYNSIGKLVCRITSIDEHNYLDLSSLSPGMYILKIYSINQTYVITQIILQTN
ncbi:MAG: T9SS type A sorting domain-containing protein [Saprospiraceae bacterium]|nr:T9SS type A sorting domain-containing protein [Saprospiraceae bacterium]MBL0082362.1 T9SS type A sorting domain-containing protein [Saprospiraceae bacterium]